MLIEERAGRRVLVDEQGVEVRPREAVVYDGEVYYLGWVAGDRVALIGDLRLLPVPPTRRPLVDMLARPERLSRADAANPDRRPSSTFPEFARRMETIVHDIIELAGLPMTPSERTVWFPTWCAASGPESSTPVTCSGTSKRV